MPGDRLKSATWPLALGTVAVAFGGLVPLPGIDYPGLRSLVGDGGGFFSLSVGPIGNTVQALVLAYAFALTFKRPWAWRAALVFYLGCSLVQGFGVAFWLEGLNGDFSGLGGLDVVRSPGWGFRLMVTLSYAAGGSILWFIAQSIDATGRATGALFFLLVRVLINELGAFSLYGGHIARGTIPWVHALPLMAMPVAVLVLTWAIYQRPAVQWPVKLWRWELRSHLDVIAIVAVSSLPGSIANLAALGGLALDPGWIELIDALLALSVGMSATYWWWQLASRERTDDGDAAADASKPTKTFAAVCAAALALFGAGGVAFAGAGGIERLMTPLPLEGDQAFSITLVAETAFGMSDADDMVSLLEELGANVNVTSSDERAITLEVSDALSRESVLDVLSPVQFRLSPVIDIRQYAGPEVLRLGRLSGYGDAQDLVAECDAVRDLAGTLSPADNFGARCRFGVGPSPNAVEQCSVYCLSDDAVLRGGDIQDADVSLSEYDGGLPVVSVTLTADGSRRFENYTANHIQGRIAIVINDEVLSAPVIQSRIGGGRVQISLGAEGDYDVLLQEAERLAAAIRPGGVRTSWRLQDAE